MKTERLMDDLQAEGDVLFDLLKSQQPSFFDELTSFKRWTIHDVVAHLHYSDYLALLAATEPKVFHREVSVIMESMQQGASLMDHTRDWLTDDLKDAGILPRWYSTFCEMVEVFRAAPADARYDWFGPPMGVAMFATARQMETWAHGLSLFDAAGVERQETDRIRNICVIGCKTFAWTFQNRGEAIPGTMPKVTLALPSGALFEEGDGDGSIDGKAVDFAKVVTQTRNIADVGLTVLGDVANQWMAVAQCFAGPPEQPPAPGTRL